MSREERRFTAEFVAVEQKLRRELDAARAKYEQTNAQFHRLTQVADSLGLNTTDGSFALRKVNRHYDESLREYRKCLRRFCELILHGKIPPSAHE
jgi:hypothetical protein